LIDVFQSHFEKYRQKYRQKEMCPLMLGKRHRSPAPAPPGRLATQRAAGLGKGKVRARVSDAHAMANDKQTNDNVTDKVSGAYAVVNQVAQK
jgi:hypothetical protein